MATNPMKVDLEALERDTRLYQFPVLDLETLNSLIAEVRAARQAQTLLKRIQWSGWSYNEQDGTHTSICPECDARFRDGHRPVCALAKLIADPPAALASPSVPTGAVQDAVPWLEADRVLAHELLEALDDEPNHEVDVVMGYFVRARHTAPAPPTSAGGGNDRPE